jgi:multicomponent Na+:H+ antiporter subunit D
MVLALSTASALGVTAALLHMFNHGLMKGALFMALGAVALRMGGTGIAQMQGLARTMPWTFWAFVFAGLSLVGVPLTVGFISKWYLILAVLEQGWWPLVVVIVIGSLLALVYIGRVVEAGWFGDPSDPERREAPLSLLLPTWSLVVANFYFGIDTRLTVGFARLAAGQLMGGAP